MSSNTGPIPGDVFDVKKVRKFIELMNEHDLAEIDLRQGDQRIRLRRPEAVTMSAMPAMPMSARRRMFPPVESRRLGSRPLTRASSSLSRARWWVRSTLPRTRSRRRLSKLAIAWDRKRRFASSKR